MTLAIPTIEPTKFQAGVTVQWTKSPSDFPASTWTLTYYLKGPASPAAIVATADGDTHSVTIAAAVTANYNPGGYVLIGRVVDKATGLITHLAYDGRLTVEPNFSAADAEYDPRTDNEIILDNITAVLKGEATFQQASYQIAGRALSRFLPSELRAEQTHYRTLVANEKRKRMLDEGRKPPSRMILGKFG